MMEQVIAKLIGEMRQALTDIWTAINTMGANVKSYCDGNNKSMETVAKRMQLMEEALKSHRDAIEQIMTVLEAKGLAHRNCPSQKEKDVSKKETVH